MQVSYPQVARWLLVMAGIMLAFRLAGDMLAYAYIPLALAAVSSKKSEWIFVILILITGLTICNSTFFPRGANYYMAIRIAYLVMSSILLMRTLPKSATPFMPPFYCLFGYIFYMMLVSMQGWMPIVSELKAILLLMFLLCFTLAAVLAWQGQMNFQKIRSLMLAMCVFYIFGSLVSIPFPGIGKSMLVMKTEGRGGEVDLDTIAETFGLFNGMTWHSQTLGPLLAILSAFLLADYLFNIHRTTLLYRLLLLGIPILVYITSSRTAMGAYLCSIIFTVFFYVLSRGASQTKKIKVVFTTIALFSIAGVLLFTSPAGMDRVEAFARKTTVENLDNATESLQESVLSTRQGLIDDGLDNWRDSPILGNGFQVSKNMEMYEMRDLPALLSAPVEKGVLPIMILEEGGVFGAIIFIVFLVVTYSTLYSRRFYGFLSCFSVLLILNAGEACFFSISGGGGTVWMVCFAALVLDIERLRRPQTHFTAKQPV